MNQKPNTHPATERIINKGWMRMRVLLDQHLPQNADQREKKRRPMLWIAFLLLGLSTLPLRDSNYLLKTHYAIHLLSPHPHMQTLHVASQRASRTVHPSPSYKPHSSTDQSATLTRRSNRKSSPTAVPSLSTITPKTVKATPSQVDASIAHTVKIIKPLRSAAVRALPDQELKRSAGADIAVVLPSTIASHYFLSSQIGQPLLFKFDIGKAYALSKHHSWDWSLSYQMHIHRADTRKHNYKSQPFSIGKFSFDNPFEGISGIAQDPLLDQTNYSNIGAPHGFAQPQPATPKQTPSWQIQIAHYRLGMFVGLYQRIRRKWRAGLRLGGLLAYNKIKTQNGSTTQDNSITYMPLHYPEVRTNNQIKLNLNIESVVGLRIHRNIEIIGSLLYEYAPLWYQKDADPKSVYPKLLYPSAYEYTQTSLQKLPLHDWHWSIGLRYAFI